MKFLERQWKGKNYKLYVQRDHNSLWIHFQGKTILWEKKKDLQKIKKQKEKSSGRILASIPGRIQKLFVKKGDKVKKGQNLLSLSAMKIEYGFKAEGDGLVTDIFCKEGESVEAGKELVKIKHV